MFMLKFGLILFKSSEWFENHIYTTMLMKIDIMHVQETC